MGLVERLVIEVVLRLIPESIRFQRLGAHIAGGLGVVDVGVVGNGEVGLGDRGVEEAHDSTCILSLRVDSVVFDERIIAAIDERISV